MSATEDDWDEPEAEYYNEVAVCRHGIPKGHGCEWCDEEKAEREE